MLCKCRRGNSLQQWIRFLEQIASIAFRQNCDGKRLVNSRVEQNGLSKRKSRIKQLTVKKLIQNRGIPSACAGQGVPKACRRAPMSSAATTWVLLPILLTCLAAGSFHASASAMPRIPRFSPPPARAWFPTPVRSPVRPYIPPPTPVFTPSMAVPSAPGISARHLRGRIDNLANQAAMRSAPRSGASARQQFLFLVLLLLGAQAMAPLRGPVANPGS